MEDSQHGEQGQTTDEQEERTAVCRAVAKEFALPEVDCDGSVFLAADWPGEVEEGAVLLVQTGNALPSGDTGEVAQAWMRVNDRLEEEGVGLYCEVKSATLTAFYRFY